MRSQPFPYASFSRHLTDKPEPPPPDPVPPEKRVVTEAIERLTAIEATLADTQRQVLAHLPDAVRLKLARIVLTAAEKSATALTVFKRYDAQSTVSQGKQNVRRQSPRAAQ